MNRLHFLHRIHCCLNERKYVFPCLAFLGGQAGYKNQAASSHLPSSSFGGERQPVLAALCPTKQPAHGCGVSGPHIFGKGARLAAATRLSPRCVSSGGWDEQHAAARDRTSPGTAYQERQRHVLQAWSSELFPMPGAA